MDMIKCELGSIVFAMVISVSLQETGRGLGSIKHTQTHTFFMCALFLVAVSGIVRSLLFLLA